MQIDLGYVRKTQDSIFPLQLPVVTASDSSLVKSQLRLPFPLLPFPAVALSPSSLPSLVTLPLNHRLFPPLSLSFVSLIPFPFYWFSDHLSIPPFLPPPPPPSPARVILTLMRSERERGKRGQRKWRERAWMTGKKESMDDGKESEK